MKKNDACRRLAEGGLIAIWSGEPNAADGVKGLLAGGIDLVEARGEERLSAMAEMQRACPNAVVGVGGLRGAKEARAALRAGAAFVSTFGLDEQVDGLCRDEDALYLPCCTTAAEVYAAASLGLDMVNLFPTGLLGGECYVRTLCDAFPDMTFVLEGAIGREDVGRYACLGHMAAICADWLLQADDVKAEAEKAVSSLMGFELYHLGINMPDANASRDLAELFGHAFGFEFAEGPFAYYASRALRPVEDVLFNAKGEAVTDGPGAFYQTADFEIMKSLSRGQKGHLGIRTNDVRRAIVYLAKRGYRIDERSMFTGGGRIFTIYLVEEQSFGGFAVHLLQKPQDERN